MSAAQLSEHVTRGETAASGLTRVGVAKRDERRIDDADPSAGSPLVLV